MAFTIISHNFSSLSIGEVFNWLLANPMEFNPYALIVFIYKTVCMTAKTMHCAVRFRNTTVTHDDCYLVDCLWQARPEIPVCCRIAKICFRIPFYSAVQIRELQWIADKEYRCVVTYEVPVSFFRIKFYGKATNVAFCIGRTTLTSNGGETHE